MRQRELEERAKVGARNVLSKTDTSVQSEMAASEAVGLEKQLLEHSISFKRTRPTKPARLSRCVL